LTPAADGRIKTAAPPARTPARPLEYLGKQLGRPSGWGGDRSVIWVQRPTDGGKTCVRTRYAVDTPGDLGQLTAAFTTWAAADGNRTVQRSGDRLDVTMCALVPPPPGVARD
jgi:hypothetical protein